MTYYMNNNNCHNHIKTTMFLLCLLPRITLTRCFQTMRQTANFHSYFHPIGLIRRKANVLRHSYSPVSYLDGNDHDHDHNGANFEKYDMVPLPDSMVDTTIWIGNLDEFVSDSDLAELMLKKGTSSLLFSVPCAIARRPNNDSLGYGFVTFATVTDAEMAVNMFDGYDFDGRELKVQHFKDSKHARAKVPEKLVAYVLGTNKVLPNGAQNNLRRICKDDVERLSRGQPSKKKGYGSRGVPHRLNENERRAFDRAAKYGFVTLDGTGYRRGRKGSPLSNIHRQWCDARGKPQIILCKATGGRMLDNVIVDLSPLRLGPLEMSGVDLLFRWKTDILNAAQNSGMVLADDIVEDNTFTLDIDYDDEIDGNEISIDVEVWTNGPIWKLPAVSLGVFEGERTKAKNMARELSSLWNVPEEVESTKSAGMNYSNRKGATNRRSAGAKKGGRTKNKGMNMHRRQKKVDFESHF